MRSTLSRRRLRPAKPTSPSPRPELGTDAGILARHAENPSAFLALNDETCHFTLDGVDGVVASQLAGRRTIVQLGGAFADADPSTDQALLLAAFLDFAHVQRRKVAAVQLMRRDAELYATYGFTVNQFGADYARELSGFSLRGKRHMQLRNKVSRARRAGVTVVEAGIDRLGPQLDEIDRLWLRSKGRHVKELKLMVGQRGGPAQPSRRLFTALDEAGPGLAHMRTSPPYGSQARWLHDLSRRGPPAPPARLAWASSPP